MEIITVWVLDSDSLKCGIVLKGVAQKIDEDTIEFLAEEAPSVLYGKGIEWYDMEAEAIKEFQVRKNKRMESIKREIESGRQEIIRLGKLEPKAVKVAPEY